MAEPITLYHGNVYFPEDEISTDDLYFVCYMIERTARQLKQPNKYVANAMGHDELAKKLSLADTLHSENPLAVSADWIDEYHLRPGNYNVQRYQQPPKWEKYTKDSYLIHYNKTKTTPMLFFGFTTTPFARLSTTITQVHIMNPLLT